MIFTLIFIASLFVAVGYIEYREQKDASKRELYKRAEATGRARVLYEG